MLRRKNATMARPVTDSSNLCKYVERINYPITVGMFYCSEPVNRNDDEAQATHDLRPKGQCINSSIVSFYSS